MESENQRVMLTKRLLQEALLALLREKSLASITVSELCKRAGINRSTFYAHYGNPGDLFDEGRRALFDGLRARVTKTSHEYGSMDLAHRVAAICAYLRKNRDLATLMFAESGHVSDFALETLALPIQDETLDEILKDTYDEPTRKLLYTYLTSGTYQLIRQWLLEDIQKTPEEIGALAQKVAYEGWLAHSNTL